MTDTPKYYLAEVPQDLRRHVLDLCFKRLWQDGLEALQARGFSHYTVDDLMNFYSWAPTFLPAPEPPGPKSAEGGCGGAQPQHSLSASSVAPPAADAEPRTTDPGLQEARQSLVQLLAARAQTAAAKTPAVDGGLLLAELRDVINRYVVLPPMAAEALALWIVHTHAFTLRQVTTYIGVVSPEKRCGKTTLLELLGLLAHEAVAAANISPSALFRVIEEKRPTLVIDEADTFLQGRDEMAGILNAGYRKSNSYVIRVGEGKTRKNALARFSCWCPKVMAAIGRLPDTLADRCIVITMQRKMPGEKCERIRELDATQYQQRCAEFVQSHSDAITRARPDIPSALNDRAADIWEPLLAVADLAGGDWPSLARQAAEKLSASYDDDITLIGYLLKDLRNFMVLKGLDRVLSRDLVAYFNPRHDRPWEDLRRGRVINEWWLGRRLSELGIRARAIRTGDNVAKGYFLADIEPAFRRYVPNHPDMPSAQSSTSKPLAYDASTPSSK